VAKGASTLRNKYAIVGIGQTEFSRNSGRTTRRMGAEAVRQAIADSGLSRKDTSWGITCYQSNDAAGSEQIASDVGIRLDYQLDAVGGGSSTETLISLAIGAIEAGQCDAMIIFRTMNGYTENRIGGTPVRAASTLPPWTVQHGNDQLHTGIYGVRSALQSFALSFVRHMHEYGTTLEQAAAVKVAHSHHASNNPKALYKERVTVEDVLASRYIVEPFGLLHCCVETDNAVALIITDTARARDLSHRPVAIKGTGGRSHKWRSDYHWGDGPINQNGGIYTRDLVFANAGVGPEDIDATGSYDAFTFTTIFQLEAYGFCPIGEGGNYVSDGTINLGGRRPNNTSGGHLCEGYTHGIALVTENVRQLRGEVDDYCPQAAEGIHTYDYSEGQCRALRDPVHTMNMGWAQPSTSSALILTNDI